MIGNTAFQLGDVGGKVLVSPYKGAKLHGGEELVTESKKRELCLSERLKHERTQ